MRHCCRVVKAVVLPFPLSEKLDYRADCCDGSSLSNLWRDGVTGRPVDVFLSVESQGN